MMQSGLQKAWVRFLLTFLTVVMMALIFFFSTEPAERSDRTSGQLSMTVIKALHPDYDTYTQERKDALFADVQHIVRKCAHFTEYMILGILLRMCLESWFGKRSRLNLYSLGTGTLYACTDELHQLIIDGRSGQITDVLLDGCGVLIGVLFVFLILKNHKGKRTDNT